MQIETLKKYGSMASLSLLFLSSCGFTKSKTIDHITFNIGLPANSTYIASQVDRWGPDSKWWLIFDSDQSGIEEFALRYSGGTPLSDYLIKRTDIYGGGGNCNAFNVNGIPWDLSKIKNGRYFRRNDTNGFVSIDMETKRVYVFR